MPSQLICLGGGAPPGMVRIELTAAERSDCDQISSLLPHVPKSDILQMYLACDKDVNRAVNILMSDQASFGAFG